MLHDGIRRRPFVRDFSFYLFGFATWIPAAIFFNTHVGEFAWINGASMYPFLNTDFNETGAQDCGWVNKWNPTEGLQRGMIVTFW